MRSLLLIFSMLVIGETLQAQSLTVEYIDDWIKLCEPNYDLSEKEKVYLIDGVLYEGLTLEEKLTSFDTSNPFLLIDYLYSDSIKSTFFKPNLLIVLIQEVQKVNRKDRKEVLKDVQGRFTDQYKFRSHHILSNSKDPVLYINEEKIHHAEAKEKIFNLKAKDLQYVMSTKHAPVSYYGGNAKNGVVKIWTK